MREEKIAKINAEISCMRHEVRAILIKFAFQTSRKPCAFIFLFVSRHISLTYTSVNYRLEIPGKHSAAYFRQFRADPLQMRDVKNVPYAERNKRADYEFEKKKVALPWRICAPRLALNRSIDSRHPRETASRARTRLIGAGCYFSAGCELA